MEFPSKYFKSVKAIHGKYGEADGSDPATLPTDYAPNKE